LNKRILIVVALIILISTLSGCFDNNSNGDENEKNDNESSVKIEKAEISNFYQDTLNNTTSFDLDFKIIWKNLPVNISELAFKFEFIKNDERYFYYWSRWILYNDYSKTQEAHKDEFFIGIIPIPDNYRIEVHWRDEDSNYKEFIGSVERDYKQ
jgi:hypothetical protein